MSRMISSMTRMILERAVEEGKQAGVNRHPTVLSCGGMYLPRTRTSVPGPVNYHVLNLANENEPIKIYVGRRANFNLLYQVLAKEAMN